MVFNQAIRAAANKASNQDGDQPKIKFRNYQPYDANLKKNIVEKEDPLLPAPDEDVSLDIIKRELAANATDDMYVLPKKVNWDLKQQIENDVAKLKRRTQKAIVEILREKLKAANEQEGDE